VSWRQKAALQRVLSAAPFGHHANYLFQRHVTHSLPLTDAKLQQSVAQGVHHIQRLEALGRRSIDDGQFFEFGAGYDLHMPLILWCLGVDRQFVVDIRRLVRRDVVAGIARRLAGTARRTEFTRVPPALDGKSLGSFLADLGIEYRAPGDARATGLAEGSVDFITSTNTLEHIPPDDMLSILSECRRILRDDGLLSFRIDYKDHFSYFDRSISAYNFLTMDEATWRRRNPSLAFQNRLRHWQYLDIIRAAGFAVVEEDLTQGTAEDLDRLRSLPLAMPYAEMEVEQLAVRSSRMVLAKAPAVVDGSPSVNRSGNRSR
jgi:SAM-dependent methyltransferase